MTSKIMISLAPKRVVLGPTMRQGIMSSSHYRAFQISARLQIAAPQFVVDAVKRHKANGLVSLWELASEKKDGPNWKEKLARWERKRADHVVMRRQKYIEHRKRESKSDDDWYDIDENVQIRAQFLSNSIRKLKATQEHIKEQEESLALARAKPSTEEDIQSIVTHVKSQQDLVRKMERSLDEFYGQEWRTVDPAVLPKPTDGLGKPSGPNHEAEASAS